MMDILTIMMTKKCIDLILQYLECGGIKMSPTNYSRYKYTPDEIDEKEFLSKFVVRNNEFDDAFEDIKNADYDVPNQHYIIIGQRGQGKTTLLRKIMLEVQKDRNFF